jgi:Leucine-rich repeat (LRR) protein
MPGLGDLHSLETLNVFGNKICLMPIRMGNCEGLINLNLGKNPLSPLSPEVCPRMLE